MTELLSFIEGANRSLSEFEFLQKIDDKASKLGMGSFAEVKLVKEKVTDKLCALKIININLSKSTLIDFYSLRNEIQVHKSLNHHPNIIQYHGYICEKSRVLIVLDYAENGNLYNYMQKKKSLSENEVFKFFYQACQAIQHLHKCDIIHRDIKPENLLLDQQLNLKLCDFGWSTFHIHNKRTTFCGTYEYMAPEILRKKPYDYRVDIWSLGVLLYELYHKEAPYKGRTLPDICASLEKNHVRFGIKVPAEAKDLIQKLLKFDPRERLSIEEIFKHPWIQKHKTPKEKQSLCLSPRQKIAVRGKSKNLETPYQENMLNKENITPKGLEKKQDIPKFRAKKALTPLLPITLDLSLCQINKPKEEREKAEKKFLDTKGLEIKPLDEAKVNLDIERIFSTKSKGLCSTSPLPKYLVNGLVYKQKESQNQYSEIKSALKQRALSPYYSPGLNNTREKLVLSTTVQKKNKGPTLLKASKSPRHQRLLKFNGELNLSLHQNENYFNTKPNQTKENHGTPILCSTPTPIHNFTLTPMSMKLEKEQSLKRCKAFKNLANQFATEISASKLGTIVEKIPNSSLSSTTVSSRSRNENYKSIYTIEAEPTDSYRSRESNKKITRFQTEPEEKNIAPIPFTYFQKGAHFNRRIVQKPSQNFDESVSQLTKENLKPFFKLHLGAKGLTNKEK